MELTTNISATIVPRIVAIHTSFQQLHPGIVHGVSNGLLVTADDSVEWPKVHEGRKRMLSVLREYGLHKSREGVPDKTSGISSIPCDRLAKQLLLDVLLHREQLQDAALVGQIVSPEGREQSVDERELLRVMNNLGSVFVDPVLLPSIFTDPMGWNKKTVKYGQHVFGTRTSTVLVVSAVKSDSDSIGSNAVVLEADLQHSSNCSVSDKRAPETELVVNDGRIFSTCTHYIDVRLESIG